MIESEWEAYIVEQAMPVPGSKAHQMGFRRQNQPLFESLGTFRAIAPPALFQYFDTAITHLFAKVIEIAAFLVMKIILLASFVIGFFHPLNAVLLIELGC